MGCRNQHGKPPSPVTWGPRRRWRYKRKKKKKYFKEETAPWKRVTVEKGKWAAQSRPARSRGSRLRNSLSIPPAPCPSSFPGLRGHGALPFPPTQAGYRKPEKGTAASASDHSAVKTSPTLSSRRGGAVSILGTQWLGKEDVTGPRKAAGRLH